MFKIDVYKFNQMKEKNILYFRLIHQWGQDCHEWGVSSHEQAGKHCFCPGEKGVLGGSGKVVFAI